MPTLRSRARVPARLGHSHRRRIIAAMAEVFPYFQKFVSKLNSDYKVPGLGLIQRVLDDYVARKTKQVRTVSCINHYFFSISKDRTSRLCFYTVYLR